MSKADKLAWKYIGNLCQENYISPAGNIYYTSATFTETNDKAKKAPTQSGAHSMEFIGLKYFVYIKKL